MYFPKNGEFSGVKMANISKKQCKTNILLFNNHSKGIQHFIKNTLFISQWFGLFPLTGVGNDWPDSLNFSWKSKRMIYSLCIIIVQAFVAAMTLNVLITGRIDLRNSSVLSFYCYGFLVNLIFIKIAKRWPDFMRIWYKMEERMNKYNHPGNLAKTIKITNIILLSAASAEQILGYLKVANNIKTTAGNEDFLETVVRLSFAFVVEYIPFSYPLATLLLVTNLLSAFSWNFIDLFIMNMSIALADRFAQFTFIIKTVTAKRMQSRNFWKATLENYNILYGVFKEMQSILSSAVFFSIGNNIFFTLVQLFNTLHKRDAGFDNFYFFFSFGLVVIRTVGVSVFAAKINDNCKETLYLLMLLPSEAFFPEVERLMDQIYYNPAALSGWQLFSVTRGLIFGIAGTIVSYELLLFQFNVKISF